MPGTSPLWEMQLAALVREVPASDSRLGYPAEHGVRTSRLLRKPGYPGAWPRACSVRVRHSGRAAVLRGGPNSPTALQVHTQNICHARARNFGVESSRSMKLVSSERNVKYFNNPHSRDGSFFAHVERCIFASKILPETRGFCVNLGIDLSKTAALADGR